VHSEKGVERAFADVEEQKKLLAQLFSAELHVAPTIVGQSPSLSGSLHPDFVFTSLGATRGRELPVSRLRSMTLKP
jgi:hypothetical protein